MSNPGIYWVPSPMFSPGHPAPLRAVVFHRMVGTLRSTDAAFSSKEGRQASTNFGVGYGCGRSGHPTTAHIHQYVALGDQAWGNGNWDASGQWDDIRPVAYLNSQTISIEHHDNGGRTLGTGKGVVPEPVIQASIWLAQLLFRGDAAEMQKAGIRFRTGSVSRIAAELRALTPGKTTVIDHHFIAGRLKPYCWQPWSDDKVGFPQSRYLAALTGEPPLPDTSTAGDTVNTFQVPTKPTIGDLAKGKTLYTTDALDPKDPNRIILDPGRTVPLIGTVRTGVRAVEYVDEKGVHSGKAYFIPSADLTNIRLLPTTGDDGYTKATQDAAVAAQKAADDANTKTLIAAAVAAERARIRGVLGV